MISVYCWRKDQKAGHWLDANALRQRKDELLAEPHILWIDLEAPTPDEEALVFKDFMSIHSLTLEDITRISRKESPHLPKVEEFPDYLFVVANPLDEKYWKACQAKAPLHHHEGCLTTQLSAVLTPRLLITHHYEPLYSIQELRSFMGRHETQAERGPDFLFHHILDGMVDQYAPVLDHFDDSLEAMEEEILNRPGQHLLARLLGLKRQIISLRKTLVYEREVLSRLARGEFDLIDEREMVYYRNVYDHLVRFTELIESSRDMVSDLTQTQLAAVSNKLNEIMKVLTMISTIVLPMTLIAGIYGMNFDSLPGAHDSWGFPLSLGLMLLTGFGSLAFFRWRGWI